MRQTLPVPTLLALAAALAAADQPSGGATPGGALVVTATRLEADAFEQPYALYQQEATDIAETNARTYIDALDRTPGVNIQRTAGNQASPYIRGLTGQQTLLMFDGVRLNQALFRSGPNQYAAMLPGEALGRIDVILGTGTTVLGSDGLTGAIDFRLAEAGRGQQRAASPWAAGRYGSAEGGGASAGIDGRIGDWAYSFDGAYASYGELRGGSRTGDRLFGDAAGSSTIPNTDYEQASIGGRVAYLGFADQRIEVSAGRVEQTSAERPDGYYENSNTPTAISRSYDPQLFEYAHLRHTARHVGPWDLMQSTVWFHRNYERQTREDISSNRYRRRVYNDEVTTLGGDVQLTHRAGGHEVTYGATAYQDRISTAYERYRSANGDLTDATATLDQTGASNPGSTTVPNGSRFTGLAGFAQDFWRFADSWSALAGLRYDRVSWKLPITADRPGYASFGDGTLENDASAWTGNVRIAWQPSDPWITYAGLSQGFRTPTASDLAGGQDRASSSSGGTGPQTEGNPDLDPEKSLTVEWGARFAHGADTVSLSLFHTRLKDLIATEYIDVDHDGDIDTADRAVRVNSTWGTLQGGEFAFDVGVPLPLPAGWRLAVVQSTSFVSGETYVPQPDGTFAWQHISRANTLTGRAGIRLAGDRRWYALAQVRWADRYDEPAPGDANDVRMTIGGAGDPEGRMPGYAVFDLKGGWEGGDWRIDGGIENLGNITYRPLGSGADGAGLQAVVSASLRM